MMRVATKNFQTMSMDHNHTEKTRKQVEKSVRTVLPYKKNQNSFVSAHGKKVVMEVDCLLKAMTRSGSKFLTAAT